MFAPGSARSPPGNWPTVPSGNTCACPPAMVADWNTVPKAIDDRPSMNHRPRRSSPTSPICPPWKLFSVRNWSDAVAATPGTIPATSPPGVGMPVSVIVRFSLKFKYR